ncbi:hypothetical protein [Mesorhizobium sp. M7A.F.Ca.ET.027.03.2.1]|uniref:hypothetical protein n=1 Tax=Mesorhizobium sp. M7A.F.Ca.ET.027.03.2.1 TaxID=2496656 RepID=UPI000FCB78BE|nr:hypothetical protein [Mesorhizobium sp. M7A.F.Ca.ET.027.03.2.1]RVD66769.1 hypothetical protein EN750_01885 [Mesorhizobium sp. M7A.F.Ca.ET.027.03.2.1]
MLTFTRKDGKKFTVNPSSILRIRNTIEADQPAFKRSLPGITRIDAGVDYYAMETLDDVVALVQTELKTLVKFRSRSNVPIWINAKEASGPYPVSQSEIADGIHSRLKFGGLSQLVGNSHQEVLDAITLAGGKPEPMPTDGSAFALKSFVLGGKIKARTDRGQVVKLVATVVYPDGSHKVAEIAEPQAVDALYFSELAMSPEAQKAFRATSDWRENPTFIEQRGPTVQGKCKISQCPQPF